MASWRTTMFPMFASSLMSGASSLVSSLFNAQTANNQIAAQEQMQNQTEQFNAGQAQIARDYNTQMSNTAYQRASADMKAAGLNPMMMFGSGGAASTPGSPTASVGTPSVPRGGSVGQGIGEAMDKMVSSAIASKTFDKMTQEIANLQSQQALTSAVTKTEAERPELVKTQRFATETGTHLQELQFPGARFSAKSAEDLLSMPDWLRSSLNIGSYGGRKVSDVIAPIASTAGAAGRISDAFSQLQSRKINEGNFIGKYGVPIDEYLSQ